MTSIAIVIPVYKVPFEYLDQCMKSVINQTYRNIEIIIVDDGSPKEWKDKCDSYTQLDDRVRVIHKANGGLSDARNKGLTDARSEWIMFVDGDDWIEEEMIEELVKVAQEQKADMVKASYWLEGKRSIAISPAFEKLTKIEKQDFQKKLYPILLTSSKANSIMMQLVKRECFHGLEQKKCDFFIGEDLYTNLLIFQHANAIVWLPKNLYHYRENEKSITKKETLTHIKRKIESCLKSHQKLVDFMKQNGTKQQVEMAEIKKIAESSYLLLRLLDHQTRDNKEEVEEFLENYLKNSLVRTSKRKCTSKRGKKNRKAN